MSHSLFRSIRRPLVTVCAAAFLLTACSKEPAADANAGDSAASTSGTSTAAAPAANPAPVAASRDVCAMISAEELKTATGIVGEGAKSTSGGADVCTWMSAEGKGAVVQVYPYASKYEQSREAFEGLYKTKSEELPGLGEKAFYIGGKTGSIMNTATISALKGTTPVSVQIMSASADAATLKKEAVALTQVLLGKL